MYSDWGAAETQVPSARTSQPLSLPHLACRLTSCLLAVVSVAVVAPSVSSAHSVQSKACAGNGACSTASQKPRLKLYFTGRAETATLDGFGWQPSKEIDLRFSQFLADRPLRPSQGSDDPAITGVVVRSDSMGRFRIVMPGIGPCNLTASILAEAGDESARIANRIRCMESANPPAPVEAFRVAIGSEIRAIYATTFVHERYSLELYPQFPSSRPLGRSEAAAIARRVAGAPSAPVTTARGSTGVGPSGLWTDVWEVWVGGVQVPQWGPGYKVVIIVRATQSGVQSPRKGDVLASWYAA